MPEILTANEIDPALLDTFLQRAYQASKADFLREYGAWWHGSNANRLVLLVDDEIAGYCAVIPARVWVAGQVREALWWVDLVIAPEFRGRGLQTLFDERIRSMADLLIGFPNELAARIHRKHGWGVRQDLSTLLLPLRPLQVKSVAQAHGGKRAWALRVGALALTPLAVIWRTWISMQRPKSAWRMPACNPEILAGVFQRAHRVELNTIWRDAGHFAWRYGQAPDPQEYRFYLAGPRQAPTHFLVTRQITPSSGPAYVRILDVIGDPTAPVVRDLFHLALQDAIQSGASQVTCLTTHPAWARLARSFGFLFSSVTGFCWLSAAPDVMTALAAQIHLTLADSDNDPPS